MANIDVARLEVPTGSTHPEGSSFEVVAILENTELFGTGGKAGCRYNPPGTEGQNSLIEGHRARLEYEILGQNGTTVKSGDIGEVCVPIQSNIKNPGYPIQVPGVSPGLYDVVVTAVPLPEGTNPPSTKEVSIEITERGGSSPPDPSDPDPVDPINPVDPGDPSAGPDVTAFVLENPALSIGIGITGIVATRTLIESLIGGD